MPAPDAATVERSLQEMLRSLATTVPEGFRPMVKHVFDLPVVLELGPNLWPGTRQCSGSSDTRSFGSAVDEAEIFGHPLTEDSRGFFVEHFVNVTRGTRDVGVRPMRSRADADLTFKWIEGTGTPDPRVEPGLALQAYLTRIDAVKAEGSPTPYSVSFARGWPNIVQSGPSEFPGTLIETWSVYDEVGTCIGRGMVHLISGSRHYTAEDWIFFANRPPLAPRLRKDRRPAFATRGEFLAGLRRETEELVLPAVFHSMEIGLHASDWMW